MDTLDNTAALKLSKSVTGELFGAVSEENVERIKRQNDRKISVIIGNPPYNANQKNENENNKNRQYPEIDKRIKATYVKESTAQKTKLYDMYSRFFRWASDRIEDDGIVAFVTNRSFLDKRNFDGFRKLVAQEFGDIYVVDLGGDVRDNPKLSGTTHNVFGIRIGVAISFLVKRSKGNGCRIHYGRRPEFETGEEKLVFLHSTNLERAAPDLIRPDAKHNWLNLTTNDFETFLPLATKETKRTKLAAQERAIFKRFSLGVSTNRDDWLYDRDHKALERKVRYLIKTYDVVPSTVEEFPDTLKWSETLKRRKLAAKIEPFSAGRIRRAAYRPFFDANLYQSALFIDRPGLVDELFPPDESNRTICFTDPTAQKPWLSCALDGVADLHFVGAGAGAICIPNQRFKDGQRLDNITDWALAQFVAQYGDKDAITKDDIFAYVYGVLHDPVYRQTYALNLKREFPRIPFYPNFKRWRDWGQALLDLHIGYDAAAPFPLLRTDVPDEKARSADQTPRVTLKADRDNGIIVLDTETQLSGVPTSAWDYTLGNRSAIDWVLDQHKEKKPRDPIIREKFNTYRFADHKERVIDLLMRVVTVSTKTVDIVEAMRTAAR